MSPIFTTAHLVATMAPFHAYLLDRKYADCPAFDAWEIPHSHLLTALRRSRGGILSRIELERRYWRIAHDVDALCDTALDTYFARSADQTDAELGSVSVHVDQQPSESIPTQTNEEK